ncbi:MAG: acetyl-CoA carboxylase biotin carboxyl carrier protein subunit [Candidatus Limnocylindrales bacterium]
MTGRPPLPSDPGERPLRASLVGVAPLVIERTPAQAAAAMAGPGAGPGRPFVQVLPGRAVDRAAGRSTFEVTVGGWRFEVLVEDAARAALRERAGHDGRVGGAAARLVVHAQIPGRVVSIRVQPGDVVELGQRLLVVEAMKMENEIRAHQAGRIERVAVTAGQLVERGDVLVVLA